MRLDQFAPLLALRFECLDEPGVRRVPRPASFRSTVSLVSSAFPIFGIFAGKGQDL